MVKFLHNGMRTSSLNVRIGDVAAFRLWNKGIGSVSIVVYLQQSNSRRLTAQEMQRKGFGTSYVIEDVRSKRETFPLVILIFLISFFLIVVLEP
jgi:hypothetical protein